MIEKINFNHDSLNLKKLNSGKFYRIDIKIGRKKYKMDIDKNVLSTVIEVYHADRDSQSKYDPKADRHSIYVKSDGIIDREIIENIENIEKAQRIVRKYERVLGYRRI